MLPVLMNTRLFSTSSGAFTSITNYLSFPSTLDLILQSIPTFIPPRMAYSYMNTNMAGPSNYGNHFAQFDTSEVFGRNGSPRYGPFDPPVPGAFLNLERPQTHVSSRVEDVDEDGRRQHLNTGQTWDTGHQRPPRPPRLSPIASLIGGFPPPQPGDVFVALMGVTGVGKSTFISLCTDKEVKVGHNLQACKHVSVCISAKHVL